MVRSKFFENLWTGLVEDVLNVPPVKVNVLSKRSINTSIPAPIDFYSLYFLFTSRKKEENLKKDSVK
jgi:hypothetical protein